MSTHRMAKALVATVALGTWLAFAAPAFAAEAPPHHIRGTIESVQDHTLTVKTRHGTADKLKLADKLKVFMVSRSKLSAIKDGEFVGITSVEKNGKPVAVEVHIFAENLRGLGEGHYPWDLESQPNMMTNANIAQVKQVKGGRELTLEYKGGTQTITVPKSATIVMFTSSSPDQLKAGRKVFVLAKNENGSEVANAVVVGKGKSEAADVSR